MRSTVWRAWRRRAKGLAAGLIAAAAAWPAAAEPPQAPAAVPAVEQPAPQSGPPTAETIAQWIRDLDADKFDVRQRATEQLGKAGSAVIEPLVEAAGKGSLEVAMRAVTILKELFESSDTATRLAAKTALERLAASENKAVASRAEGVLKPAPTPHQANRPGMFFPPLPGNLGGRIQIQGPGGNIQVIQIQAGFNGGNVHRNVQVRENGRTIKISEDNNGIKVSVTEPVGGQDQTKTYEAKDAAELKQKHPEAHKLYEKHAAKAGPNIVVQGGLGAIPQAPNLIPPQPANPPRDQRQAEQQLDQARQQLEEATRQLRAAAEADSAKETIRQALDKLDAAARALEEAQKKLQP